MSTGLSGAAGALLQPARLVQARPMPPHRPTRRVAEHRRTQSGFLSTAVLSPYALRPSCGPTALAGRGRHSKELRAKTLKAMSVDNT
jgi:hypothetical protein